MLGLLQLCKRRDSQNMFIMLLLRMCGKTDKIRARHQDTRKAFTDAFNRAHCIGLRESAFTRPACASLSTSSSCSMDAASLDVRKARNETSNLVFIGEAA